MISPRFDPESFYTPSSLTVQEAVSRYLVLRTEQGMLATSDTYRHVRKHLADRFAAAFGLWPLEDIGTDHIRTWLKTLTNPRTGEPMTTVTLRHHVIDLKVFFKRARLEGWIQRDPAEALMMPTPEEKDVSVLPIRDAFAFFKRNRDHRAVGRLALEAFGGLRYTSAGKISLEDIRFDCDGIEMPSLKHKSRKRKFRQGQPANLWTWLRHAPDECWKISPRQYREEKREMLIMAGIRPMILKSPEDRELVAELKNVWRHSFASYLLAMTKNPPAVAYAMQHTSMKTTQIYEGVAMEADARLYFAITPESVLKSWEEFSAPPVQPVTPQ